MAYLLQYVCKDPNCTGDVPFHLIHGDLDCIEMNRDAIAEWAKVADAALTGAEELVANVDVHAPGYEAQTVSIVLHPPGWVPPEVHVPTPPHPEEPMPPMGEMK